MKTTIITMFSLLLLTGPQLQAGPAGLRPRGYAGMKFRSVSQADVDTMALPDRSGVILQQVFPGTPAAAAGLLPGDVLKKYDQHAILDQQQINDITRLYYAGDRIAVAYIRQGTTMSANLTLAPFPSLTSAGVDIRHVSVPSGGIRLRAVIYSPLNSDRKKLPALLIVSALGSPRLTGTPQFNMSHELAAQAAKSGFRALRFELRGWGDSEGDDYRTLDFDTEVSDNLAALEYLRGRKDVDSSRVFVFGHSTGGVVAPLLAMRQNIAGMIVSCTIGRTFYERMAGTVRLQSALGGDSAAVTDRKVSGYMNLCAATARGDSAAELLCKSPELKGFFNTAGRIFDDRTLEYWRQFLNVNIGGLYQRISSPVLIVYCSSDHLTQLACHERIRDALRAAGNPDVTLAVIPGADHQYSLAADFRESYQHYRTGSFDKNPEPFERVIGWLTGHAGTKP